MDEGAAVAMSLHSPPEGPRYINEVVSIDNGLGSKPRSFVELADIGKDHNKLHISETYCLKSVQITVAPPANQQPNLIYDYGIANHVFSDREASVRVQAKDGWVRVEETKVPIEKKGGSAAKGTTNPRLRQTASTSCIVDCRHSCMRGSCLIGLAEGLRLLREQKR